MKRKALYFYGLIRHGENYKFDLNGMENNTKVFTIPLKDISAVVSNVKETIFDPTRENVLVHNNIITEIMKQFSIIPSKFGTVFASKTDVEILLEKLYETAVDIFKKIDNKVELGLKVLWKEEKFVELINVNEVKKLHDKLKNNKHGENNYLKMMLGQIVKDIVDSERAFYINTIHEKLVNISHDNKLNENITAKMVFNAAYLVDKGDLQKFTNQAEKIFKIYDDILEFKLSGPWPPYNFTTLKVKLDTKKTEKRGI